MSTQRPLPMLASLLALASAANAQDVQLTRDQDRAYTSPIWYTP